MRICISGSRDYKSLHKIRSRLESLPKTAIIVHGGARGVDQTAKQTAEELGLRTEEWPADWKLHGLAAGHIRNHKMIATCDQVLAFWNGQSRGTAGAIVAASDLGKPFEVVLDD